MYDSTSSQRGLPSALARTWSSFVRFNSNSKYFPKGLSHMPRAVTVDACKPVIHYSSDMKERALYLLMEGKIEEALGVTASIER